MNEILYGHDSTEELVCIDTSGNKIIEFYQTKDGTVTSNTVERYEPWYLMHTAEPNLDGVNHFNTIKRCPKLRDITELYEKTTDNRKNYLLISNKTDNYMIDSGKTLFKGLLFDDVYTLGWDLETTGLDPETCKIKMASIYDNRGYGDVFYSDNEKEVIGWLIERIVTLDPSILLGYNIFYFDIPFIMRRCEILNMKFEIGRNGQEPFPSKIQLRLGVKDSENVDAYKVWGRHNIDLYYCVQKYDFTDRKLNNYKLKNVISEYGLEKEGRTHVHHDDIAEAFRSGDPEKINNIKMYCKDDSEDLINLHRHICQADFYITQMCPMNYQRLVYAGSAGRFNVMILRSYVKELMSVPLWNTDISISIQGAQVEADASGVFKYVGDMDVRSMYPTLMIINDIFPESDTLGIMKTLLVSLRDMRYNLKNQLRGLDTKSKEYKFIKGQDLSFKILINSQFGIMGSPGFHWKDEKMCAEVTRRGRELIMRMRDKILEHNFQVIALDTDGIAFTKDDEYDINDVTRLVEEILPEGVEVETNKYKAMAVFKKKTYAVLKDDGSIMCKGNALTSSSTADCIKQFVNIMIRLLFAIKFEEDTIETLKLYYEKMRNDIISINLPIEAYSKINKITQTLKQYQETQLTPDKNGKKRAIQPIYELALNTNTHLMVGDKVSTYYGYIEIPKPLTPTEKKKLDTMNSMTPLFGEPYKPKMLKVKKLKWTYDFNESKKDIDIDHYEDALNQKIQDILTPIDDETKTRQYNIFDEKTFDYIFQNRHEDVDKFIYKDYTRLLSTGKFMTWQRISRQEEWNIIKKSGEDIFSTIQRYSSSTIYNGEPSYMPIYFDIDNSNMEIAFNDTKVIYNFFTNVLKVPNEFIDIWFSGSKGFHIEVHPKLFGITPRVGLNLVLKEIALDMINKFGLESIDYKTIYSYRRQWRIPFSINSKTGLRKTLLQFDTLNTIDEVLEYVHNHQHISEEMETYKNKLVNRTPYENKELKNWFNEYSKKVEEKTIIKVEKKPSWKYEKLKGKFPACVTFLLLNSIAKSGDRNMATMCLLSYFKESGIEMDEAISQVTNWALNIEKGLTSTTDYGKLLENTSSIAKTIYNDTKYIFKCEYIKSLMRGRDFNCSNMCVLKE